MGLLVNVEAVVNADKASALQLVVPALREAGLTVAVMLFPDRPSTRAVASPAHFPTGLLIDRYLARQLPMCDARDSLFRQETPGDPLEPLSRLPLAAKQAVAAIIEEKLAQVIYSINRRERIEGPGGLLDLLERHDVVFVMRYLSANTYGVANGVSRLQLASLEADLPQPDITFLLDVAPGTRRVLDADEADRYELEAAERQARVRELYAELVRDDEIAAISEAREPRFRRLDATLAREAIAQEMISVLIDRLVEPEPGPGTEA